MKRQQPILALVGPTATGKSAVALCLAESIGGVIISADSMQVYRGMDIGTAKPSLEDRKRIPHFLIDVADPTRNFSVADYVELAEPILEENVSAGRPVIVCGGTGYYVRALIDGICESPPGDPRFRRRMEADARRLGPEALHARLAEIDPIAAEGIHPRNLRRTIRALEVFHLSGKTITEHRAAQSPAQWQEMTCFVGLRSLWNQLDRRIEERVHSMVAQGLAGEVERLLAQGCTREHTALQAIGYKEMVEHVRGACTLDEAVEAIILATRQYARRQLTWWRPEKRVRWLLLEGELDAPKTAETVLTRWAS
jgi:tRNA dimethylallyltransferase